MTKKTINTIPLIALLAIVVLSAGCKKEQKEPDTVNVTFKAVGNAKTTISPRGVVEFIPGDKIHVFDASYGYLGYLDYQGQATAKGEPATFYGALKQWNNNTTLRFIYMGNHTPTFGKMTKVNLIDQSYEGEQSPENDLENIAENFLVSNCEITGASASATEFTGALTSVMSILALNTSAFDDGTNVKIIRRDAESSAAILCDRITIDANGVVDCRQFVPGSNGQIVTGPGRALRYVAVLPSESPTACLKLYITSNAKEGILNLTAPIEVNTLYTDYKNDVIAATSVSTDYYVDVAVSSDYVFTVNSSGKQVKFAKGNLVYDKGRFKMHKTPFVIFEHGEPGKLSTFDHFAWGTSLWDNGSRNNMPFNFGHDLEGQYWGPQKDNANINNASDYYDLTGAYARADWGVYQFGMNTGGAWRTLTNDEMNYILSNSARGSRRYLHAKVDIDNVTYVGLVIFPDNFDATLAGTYTYNSNSVYNVTNDWSTMEAAGAVFLHRAGYCYENRYTNQFNPNIIDQDGLYWLSTKSGTSSAYCLKITGSSGCYTDFRMPKSWMYSVRLVSDVN